MVRHQREVSGSFLALSIGVNGSSSTYGSLPTSTKGLTVMRQKLVIAILGALILGAFASLSFFSSPVSATMRLRIEDLSNGGDVGAVITDNGPDDINPLVGALRSTVKWAHS